MGFIKHWGGGAVFKSGNMVKYMGRGYPCCCSGHRAVAIANKGYQTFTYESEVTCGKCITIMAKRVRLNASSRLHGPVRLWELPGRNQGPHEASPEKHVGD